MSFTVLVHSGASKKRGISKGLRDHMYLPEVVPTYQPTYALRRKKKASGWCWEEGFKYSSEMRLNLKNKTHILSLSLTLARARESVPKYYKASRSVCQSQASERASKQAEAGE